MPLETEPLFPAVISARYLRHFDASKVFSLHSPRISQDYRMLFTPTLSADRDLVTATDYAAWSKAAREHDKKSGLQAWRDADESKHFDYKAIRARLERLRSLSAAGDVKGLLFVLNEGIHGNIDGMGHERLYQKARFGTKALRSEEHTS